MQGPKLPVSRYQREGVGQAVTGMLQIHLITELFIPGLSLTHLSPSFLFTWFLYCTIARLDHVFPLLNSAIPPPVADLGISEGGWV